MICQRVEFTVSQCLEECVPGQRCPPPPNPLLQDLLRDPVWLPATLVLNGVHSTARLVLQEEDAKVGVIGADFLRYLESKQLW